MDQVLPDGKNYQNASGRRVGSRDKDEEWNASRVSDWATSVLFVCRRLLECHQWHHRTHKALFCRAPSTLTISGRKVESPLSAPSSVIMSLSGGVKEGGK